MSQYDDEMARRQTLTPMGHRQMSAGFTSVESGPARGLILFGLAAAFPGRRLVIVAIPVCR